MTAFPPWQTPGHSLTLSSDLSLVHIRSREEQWRDNNEGGLR
jgi:hypothetical protein